MFQQLSGLAPAIKLKRLLQSPFTLHKGLLKKIERESRARARRQAGAHHRQDERASTSRR